MVAHHLKVTKTARYFSLGSVNEHTEEIWFVIHGFAQLAEKFIYDFKELDNGKRHIIAPEALNKFYLRAGQSEVGATWMTREDREHEIKDYIDYLNLLYDSILMPHQPVRIVILGFSQGVATVSRWAFNNQRKIDTLVFFAGEVAIELQSPEQMAAFKQEKKYFLYGNQDQYINEESSKKMKDLLAGFEIILFDGKHEINIDALGKIK